MKVPSQRQIDIAIMWLQSNEGEDGESEACKAVAAWVDHVASEHYLRITARKHGIPVAAVRRKLAGQRRCISCGKNYADTPSSLCPGCEAYQEHQS